MESRRTPHSIVILLGLSESGSQRILNNMNKKPHTLEQNYVAIEITKKVGIEIIVQTMFGYIGENEESIKETAGFCIRCSMKAGPLFQWYRCQAQIYIRIQ